MAAAALPAIEAITIRALAAFGIGVLGKTATDAAKEAQRKRREEEEKGKGGPLPPPPVPAPQTKSGSGSQSSSKDKEKRKKCDECPPDCGEKTIRKQSWQPPVVAYQVRICGLPYGPGWITEWHFAGKDFDGFDSSQCLLKEAKSTYDKFFDQEGKLLKWWKGEQDMIDQATNQSAVAVPQPPVQLKWFFMEPKSYKHFTKVFRSLGLKLTTVFEP